MTETRFRQIFLMFLVIAISVAFVAMVRTFLLTVLLAAIFAGLIYPAFQRLLIPGHRALTAALTLLLFLVLVLTPLFAVLGAVANQALQINETIRPRIVQFIQEPGTFDSWLQVLPGYRFIAPYRAQILEKAGDLVAGTGSFVIGALGGTALATASFIFYFAVMLYTMFFFLRDGPGLLREVLSYIPLTEPEKQDMVGKFVSVTRATLKGTVLIGIAQGTLSGLAFWVVGIDGALFWGAVMTVLSIIPGVGGALVWVPAVIILLATGQIWQGLGLAGFSALVVGSIDNVLRPQLVGRDTQMHELLIFFSTLGGLMLFGAMGFIIGPILAALFVTVWGMLAAAYRQKIIPAGGSEA
jgi:predicted PurR-regulated permease PerM